MTRIDVTKGRSIEVCSVNRHNLDAEGRPRAPFWVVTLRIVRAGEEALEVGIHFDSDPHAETGLIAATEWPVELQPERESVDDLLKKAAEDTFGRHAARWAEKVTE